MTSRTPQTAGSAAKRSVPFDVNAPRNRVKNDAKRLPPPFVSTLSFDYGVLNGNLHPFRTMKAVTEAAAAVPMSARTGFTNTAVTAELTKRLHKPIYN
jgi:hypothetical protein